ncbi:MAG: hypothetical protein V9H26_13925 [Verrucomicrobiota bacterium]
MEEVNYPARVMPGGTMEVTFVVHNVGSSPFYYNWPVAICLLDEQTRECVWQETFTGADIRQWLPGDRWLQFANWNVEKAHYVLDDRPPRYEIPAAANLVGGRFQLPRALRHGSYILALAILDPAGMMPSCRFAVENYFTGGRHPVGRIGVGREIQNHGLPHKSFNDLHADRNIGYRVG